MEVFNVLAALDPDDCNNLDPFNFLKVTTEELDEWLHESLANGKVEEDADTRVSEVGRRLSMCLSREIQRRNSLILTRQQSGTASRQCSNFSDFSSGSFTLPKYEQDSRGDSKLFDEYLVQPDHNVQQQDNTMPNKRRRMDSLPSPEDQLSQGRLFAALVKSSQSMSTFCKNSIIASRSSTSSSVISTSSSTHSTSSSVDSVYMPPPSSKSSTSLTPAVPLTFSVSPGLASCMTMSEKSEKEIQNWDRQMGLKKSHSKTMRATGRSRKTLQELQSQMWHGNKKECRARLA